MIPIDIADNLSSPSISFPLRLRQGMLQKTDERDTYLMLLEIMARTPRGSWAGHPLFGFQEFFLQIDKENLSEESRTCIAVATASQINTVLLELGLTRYQVESLTLDPLPKDLQSDGARWAGRTTGSRGVTLMLREPGRDRTTGYVL